MKLPRFYVPTVALEQDFWLHERPLIDRWRNANFQVGQEVVLFDGVRHERLYRIEEISQTEAHVRLVTDFMHKVPPRTCYLLWRLTSPSENDQTLRQGTTLGVRHFIPIQADGYELKETSAKQTVIRAAEAAERSDIPAVRQPLTVTDALAELPPDADFFSVPDLPSHLPKGLTPLVLVLGDPVAWPPADRKLLAQKSLRSL